MERGASVRRDDQVLDAGSRDRVAGVETLEVGPRDQSRRHRLAAVGNAVAGSGGGLTTVDASEVHVPTRGRAGRSRTSGHGAGHAREATPTLHVRLGVESVAAGEEKKQ